MRKTTKMVAVLAAMSVMILGAATMVSAAEKKNGWVKEGSDWYYYVEDEAIINEWALSGSDWYFLGEDGKMVTKKFIDHEAKEVVAGVVAGTDTYYVNKDGAMVTGWYEVETGSTPNPYTGTSKAWYYFGTTGVAYADEWVLSNGLWYFLELDGKMASNNFVDTVYYVNKDGAMITGWYKAVQKDQDNAGIAKDSWVYAGTDGKPVASGWKKVDGSWYYFGTPSGSTATASLYEMNSDLVFNDGNHEFHLKKSGAMSLGWIRLAGGDYHYADDKGRLVVNTVKKINGKYYAFDSAFLLLDDSTLDVWAAIDASDVLVGTYATETAANGAAGAVKIFKLGTGTAKDVTP